jgi:hypothetical protein
MEERADTRGRGGGILGGDGFTLREHLALTLAG